MMFPPPSLWIKPSISLPTSHVSTACLTFSHDCWIMSSSPSLRFTVNNPSRYDSNDEGKAHLIVFYTDQANGVHIAPKSVPDKIYTLFFQVLTKLVIFLSHIPRYGVQRRLTSHHPFHSPSHAVCVSFRALQYCLYSFSVYKQSVLFRPIPVTSFWEIIYPHHLSARYSGLCQVSGSLYQDLCPGSVPSVQRTN